MPDSKRNTEDRTRSLDAAPGGAAYSGSHGALLWRRLAIGAVLLLGLPAGGCSTSFSLGALTGAEEATASVRSPATPVSFEPPADGDLAYAKSAATELFARGAKNASAAWENPRTGAHGTITPIATAGSGSGCQDFLASYVRGAREVWYQGGACREGRRWVVRELKALQRT